MRWVYGNPIRGTAIDGECSKNMDDDDDQCSRLYISTTKYHSYSAATSLQAITVIQRTRNCAAF